MSSWGGAKTQFGFSALDGNSAPFHGCPWHELMVIWGSVTPWQTRWQFDCTSERAIFFFLILFFCAQILHSFYHQVLARAVWEEVFWSSVAWHRLFLLAPRVFRPGWALVAQAAEQRGNPHSTHLHSTWPVSCHGMLHAGIQRNRRINIAQIGGGGGQPSQDTHRGGSYNCFILVIPVDVVLSSVSLPAWGLYSCPLAALRDPLNEQKLSFGSI